MARTATITKEAVFVAAQAVMDRGERPTQALVRDELGGGSFTTIGPFMKEWEAARANQAEARETEIPDALQNALAEVAGRLWKTASAEAALGVEAARREVEEMKRISASEAAETAAAIQIVEGERDEAQARGEALAAENMDRCQLIERVQTDLRDQIERRTRAEALSEVAAARADRAEADRQAAVNARAHVEAEVINLREVVAGQRETVAQITADRQAALANADRVDARAEHVQSELTAALADLATERAQHIATRDKLGERLERLSVDLGNAQDATRVALAEVEALSGKVANCQKEKANLSAKLEEKHMVSKTS